MKKWFFDADYLQSCNCDYGCPCEFSAPPTTGACEGLCVWRIDKGEHDGVVSRWTWAGHGGEMAGCDP